MPGKGARKKRKFSSSSSFEDGAYPASSLTVRNRDNVSARTNPAHAETPEMDATTVDKKPWLYLLQLESMEDKVDSLQMTVDETHKKLQNVEVQVNDNTDK